MHFCGILDWDLIRFHGIFTKEEYMRQYISAEIPDLPNKSDRTAAAAAQRNLHNIIIQKNIHTCAPLRCLNEDGKCRKRFPVRNNNFTFIIRLL